MCQMLRCIQNALSSRLFLHMTSFQTTQLSFCLPNKNKRVKILLKKMTSQTLSFSHEVDFNVVEACLKNEWDAKHSQSGVFNYKLNIEKERVLDGNYRYLLQVRQINLVLNTFQSDKRLSVESRSYN